jgi:hypothetical protein
MIVLFVVDTQPVEYNVAGVTTPSGGCIQNRTPEDVDIPPHSIIIAQPQQHGQVVVLHGLEQRTTICYHRAAVEEGITPRTAGQEFTHLDIQMQDSVV